MAADPLTFANARRATVSLIPSYPTVANASGGQNEIATSYGYKLMDDPTQRIGSSVADVESDAALASAALGVETRFSI
jgi:hypothetical protein